MTPAATVPPRLNAASLGALLDAVADAAIVFDSRGRLQYANRAARRLPGGAGACTLDDLAPAFDADALAWLHRLRGTAPPQAVTLETRLRDGRTVTLELSRLPGGAWSLLLRPAVTAAPALDDLLSWLELSPSAMVMLDECGRLLHHNPAFAALVGTVPATLDDAAAPLRELLAWDAAAAADSVLQRQATLSLADGSRRRLVARLRRIESQPGCCRLLAVVEDRSADDERELAQLEIGALMDTAGVGVATFDESRGWLRSAAPRHGGTAVAGVQAISRELVDPGSAAAYERLQQALKAGERAQVRYAVRHPELGLRWLLTRIEPGRLASGRRTTSVITLDVTEQEQAQQRNEQLLRELQTILDGTSAGMAYVRGNRLVRCNRRFEALLGLADAEAQVAGATLESLFGRDRFMRTLLRRGQAALRDAGSFDTEFELPQRPGVWYSLSVRRAQGEAGSGAMAEAVAVLTDISHLKAQQAELQHLLDERQQARERLLLQATRTRAILDSVLVGIVTVRDGGIEWMNRSARRMFGGELADFVGEPIATVATPEAEHPLRRADWARVLAEGRAETFECRLQARDGRAFWVVGNVVVTGGQLTFALLDIERRRQAELRIAQAQASLERIIETAPMAIGLLDAATLQVLQLNQRAASFIGCALAEAVGRPIDELFGGDDGAQLRADLVQALAAREVTRREYRRPGPGGQARMWDARYVPLPATDDGSGGGQLLLAAADVTEQRLAEAARRDMLVKEVHHRIKNNLQGVAGLMQQIAERRPEVAPVIKEAVGQVQAIAQVYGLQVGASGPLRVRSVLEAIAASVQRMFGHPIAVEVRGTAPHRWAFPEAESIPIALTVNELLTNAVKHGAADSVRCTLGCSDEQVQIMVANGGTLPPGFDLAQVRGGVSGLGLVRALLPRRHAALTLQDAGDEVHAVITLRPPVVTRLEPL